MISADDYQFLSALLRDGSGLSLGEQKDYLIESRLQPLAAERGLGDVAGLLRAVRSRRDPKLVRAICEEMTTNETSFFRDGTPFTHLRQHVLPELIRLRQRERRLRIWCAAASTGQEPYSIAMLLALYTPPLVDWQVEILATDYSAEALERARAGLYNQFEVQRGLAVTHLVRFFAQVPAGWQISEELRRRIVYQAGNLLESFAHLGTFDVIVCRNVLIYFDAETKRDVLNRLANAWAPSGYLFLGGTESPMSLTDRLARVSAASCSVYTRRPAQGSSGGEVSHPLPVASPQPVAGARRS
jgi:chemotaxis protein methyltransferase CheR